MKKKIIVMLVMIAVIATMLTVLCVSCDGGDDFKIGLICLHDENSTYDANFINAMKSVQKELGLNDDQVLIKTGIDETNECYEAAADLVDQGCNVIFADSFGHESWMIKAAKEFKDVEFCHATGTQAHVEKLANFHNAFASIYEGRYLAGVAAGLKLQAMKTADPTTTSKIGYVGAWPYAEVKSGYTAYYLGVKSIVSDVTMEVSFTNSWYDETAEKTAAETLISRGCEIISQHADSMGAPSACETALVPNVSYNGSTAKACPNTFIVSSKINWAPYIKMIIENTKDDEAIPEDYVGTIANGSVQLTALGTAAATGTQTKFDEVKAAFAAGTLKVFDCSKFTVGGVNLTDADTTHKADINGDYAPDTNAIKTVGSTTYYDESSLRSAPYFDIDIDGITCIDEVEA